MASPRVSLCIIAKDEAALIGACLASARDAVDECIVCDTGSSDDTIDIARAAGARVVHHPWNHDFSAARNTALEAATGDFVLILDADEQLLPGAGEALRAAVATDAFDLGVLPLHHADGLDAAPVDVVRGTRRYQEPTGLARLFRHTPDLRWEGMIHESPTTWMARPGLRVANLAVPIVHYGNIPDLRLARDKAARNLALLERHCAAHPEDGPRRAYLARERLRAGDTKGALQAAEAAWHAASTRMTQTGIPAPSAPFCATMAGFLRLSGGDAAGCCALTGQARRFGLDHPNIDLLEATALVELQPPATDPALDRAATALERSLERRGEVFVDELLPGATGGTAARLLGQLRQRQGEHDHARAALAVALQLDPTDHRAQLSLAEVHIAAGSPDRALPLVEPLLAAGHPDAWLLAAEVAAAVHQRGQVDALLTRAEAATSSWLDRKRTKRLARARVEQRAWQRVLQLTGGRAPRPLAHPDAMMAAARVALDGGQLGRAMQVLPAVLATRPGSAAAWCLFATACLRQGATDLARNLLHTASQLDPHATELHVVRAELARRTTPGPVPGTADDR